MTEKAIFQATFADFKIVKTRSVAQIIVEIPLEAADNALAALGGVPRPDRELWVAIARLANPAPTQAPKATERPKHSLARQAAILCHDARFQKFIEELHGAAIENVIDEGYEEPFPEVVRRLCRVESRGEFDTDKSAGEQWNKLHAEFLQWEKE